MLADAGVGAEYERPEAEVAVLDALLRETLVA